MEVDGFNTPRPCTCGFGLPPIEPVHEPGGKLNRAGFGG